MRVNGKLLCGLLAGCVLMAGCSVSHNKNGGDNVRIATPFGGLHVQGNETSAADLGLPVYPGATAFADKDNQSANVSMSFGSFHLKVLATTYQSPDSAGKIFAFYRKALAQYGDVLECDNDKPVGTPQVASSGLTCQDDQHGKSKHVHVHTDTLDLNHDAHELRAGSPRNFRVVQIETKNVPPGMTKFGLVYLELPKGDGDSGTN